MHTTYPRPLSPSRYLVSYIPGGSTGLKFMAKLFTRLCASTISSTIEA